MYDVVLSGGRLLDPGRDVDSLLDLAIAGDQIARVAPEIDPAQARRWIDVTGKMVVSGLIDIHAHVYHHGAPNGIDPDVAGVLSGVTTVVDAGSAGSATYQGFHHHVVAQARTTVLSNIHIARNGLSHVPEAHSLDDVDVDSTIGVIASYPEIIGVKVRACGPAVEKEGIAFIDAAARAAREAGVRLMVHIGDANYGRSPHITSELLPLLEPGDLLTHLYTGAPGRAIDDKGRVTAELIEARERGVILDAAHGRYNLSFEVARAMIDQGVLPFTISTDITKPGRLVAGSMTHNMGRFLALGLPLDEVVRMSTYNPATVLGFPDEVGTLAEGTVADVTVLESMPGPWWFSDAEGSSIQGEVALRPVLTFKAGEQYAPDYGPFPTGWLPAREAV